MEDQLRRQPGSSAAPAHGLREIGLPGREAPPPGNPDSPPEGFAGVLKGALETGPAPAAPNEASWGSIPCIAGLVSGAPSRRADSTPPRPASTRLSTDAPPASATTPVRDDIHNLLTGGAAYGPDPHPGEDGTPGGEGTTPLPQPSRPPSRIGSENIALVGQPSDGTTGMIVQGLGTAPWVDSTAGVPSRLAGVLVPGTTAVPGADSVLGSRLGAPAVEGTSRAGLEGSVAARPDGPIVGVTGIESPSVPSDAGVFAFGPGPGPGEATVQPPNDAPFLFDGNNPSGGPDGLGPDFLVPGGPGAFYQPGIDGTSGGPDSPRSDPTLDLTPGTAASAPVGQSDGPVLDLSKTNDLLQQLLDEVRKGRQTFLPATDRNAAYPL